MKKIKLVNILAFGMAIFFTACNNSDGTSTPKGDKVIVHGSDSSGTSNGSAGASSGGGAASGNAGGNSNASSPSSAPGTGDAKNSGVAASQDNTTTKTPASKDSSKSSKGKKP